MGAAEVIAGERMGPGRLKLLITAPDSAENGNRGIFFSVIVFPNAASARITSFWNALSQTLGLEPLQDAGVQTAAKEQFSDVFTGESKEVGTYPCL